MISARDLIWVLRFPLQEVSDWISLARPSHLDYGAVVEVSLYLAGGSCEASHSSIHPSAWKVHSPKFGLLLHGAVMLADGTLVLLVGPNMRVREARRALHSLLVHP
jgi:hypothetical protein